PENKKFRLNEEFIYMASNYFDKDYDFNNQVTKRAIWEFRNDKFICATCPVKEQNNEGDNRNEGDFADLADIDINVVDDNIMADWNDYGPEEKTFNFKDFDAITVGGAYHARIKKGDEFSVRARGDKDGISNLRADQSGNTIEFKSNESFW